MAQIVSPHGADNISFLVLYEGKGGTWIRDGEKLTFEDDGTERHWNAWELRESFFSVRPKGDPLPFLNECGAFGRDVQPIPIEGEEAKPPEQTTIQTVGDLRVWQESLRRLLHSSPRAWGASAVVGYEGGEPELPEAQPSFDLGGGLGVKYGGLLDNLNPTVAFEITRHAQFNLEFRWALSKREKSILMRTATHRTSRERRALRHPPVTAVIRTSTVLSALLATILIDHLRAAKFKVCQRKDCRKPFEVFSAHGQIFCSQACAHVEGTRRRRRELKLRQKRETLEAGRQRKLEKVRAARTLTRTK